MIGGLSLESKKESSLIQWTIKRIRAPQRVTLSLKQHEHLNTSPCVSLGSRVRVGQKIANATHPDSVALHASISGTVTGVVNARHPLLGSTPAIILEADKEQVFMPEIGCERPDWQNYQGEALREIFREQGVVDLDQKMRPLHKTLRDSRIKTLILNACEVEPYVASDYSLMMSHAMEILKGSEILRRACQAEQVIICVSEELREAAELLKSKIYFLKWKSHFVEMLSSKHPQGESVVLLRNFLSLPLEESREPLEKGVFILNIATAFAAYEAVVLQKPLFERPVTVGGECVLEPRTVWAPIGSSFSDIFKSCRGLMRDPLKVLMGGPMTGVAQKSLDVSVLKGTQAVLALPTEIASPGTVEACTRCGDCLEVCPVEISPAMITLAVEAKAFEWVENYGASLCIGCGNCAYVCPSHRPMLELIHYGIHTLQAEGKFGKSE